VALIAFLSRSIQSHRLFHPTGSFSVAVQDVALATGLSEVAAIAAIISIAETRILSVDELRKLISSVTAASS
jgi:hypothetical protein